MRYSKLNTFFSNIYTHMQNKKQEKNKKKTENNCNNALLCTTLSSLLTGLQSPELKKPSSSTTLHSYNCPCCMGCIQCLWRKTQPAHTPTQPPKQTKMQAKSKGLFLRPQAASNDNIAESWQFWEMKFADCPPFWRVRGQVHIWKSPHGPTT